MKLMASMIDEAPGERHVRQRPDHQRHESIAETADQGWHKRARADLTCLELPHRVFPVLRMRLGSDRGARLAHFVTSLGRNFHS
jgi:hypothetical protein